MSMAPLVSIITPCLNAAAFIRQTIESVLAQDYPRIEYLIIDGGSTDETLDIVAEFGNRISLVSEPDSGAAAAINRGLRLARGSIVAWLNADDTYLPGAIWGAVNALADHPSAVAVYGDAYWTDEAGQVLRSYPVHKDAPDLLSKECLICQPACFIHADASMAVGLVDEQLQCSFDYELWMRLARYGRMVYVPQCWATSRMHRSNKTLAHRSEVFDETFGILLRHFEYVPPQWVYDHRAYLQEHKDQFYDQSLPSAMRYLAALPFGWKVNWRHPLRYTREWASGIAVDSIKDRFFRFRPATQPRR
jgi:glycosyltransferase involved in cell wall biosynthesis